ncbi:peptidase A1 family protein [Abortiporus biennis]
MFPSSLLATLTLALAVAANPVVVREPLISLPIAKRVNATGTGNLLGHDQARARGLRQLAEAKISGSFKSDAVVSVPATNGLVDYVVNVQVGTPATTFSLLVDTGSSNTWVGAGKAFRSTSSSVQTRDRVSVTYGSGDFSGTEFTDTVSLGSGLSINSQSIGVASRSDGFDGVDGILG